MITIARRAAEAAAWAADHGADLDGVTLAARSEAWKAVAETPSMLAALAEAGVVDSGAVSYALLLDVLQGTVHGTEIAVATIDTDADISSVLPDDRYELIVNLTQVGDPAELTAAWSSTGSSVAVATQYEDLRAHIHTSNVLSAYRAAAGLGKVTKVEMTDLHAYVASDTRQLTVLVASRVEEAEALLTLKPGRLLVPSDVASLVHIVETSGGHDLRFVVVGNDGDHVEEARALTGSDFPIHAVVETSEASALMHSQTAS